MQSIREAFDLPILSITELEAVLNKQAQEHPKKMRPNISLEQLKAELEQESEVAYSWPTWTGQSSLEIQAER